ncbi:MAG: outer membrane beta-barrel protein, partial [Verrucomicrobia bacterium]|nr:outer membrane beta-barrel protein [Verrucomicrobiota bacterium]
TGVIYNRIDSIAGSPETDGDFAQIPFLINAVFQAPTSTGFTPFAGAGFGFTVDYLNLNQATIQGYDITGNADTAAFAYQVMAGLAYRFAPGMDISVAYEFLGTTQPEWDVNSASGGPTQTLDLRRPYTHAVVAAVTIQF